MNMPKMLMLAIMVFASGNMAQADEKLLYDQLFVGSGINQINGCGPGKLSKLIPDKTPISMCELGNACNKHDTCYAQCLPGGAMHGKEECSSRASIAKLRRQCDKELFDNITNDNSGKRICRGYGRLYSSVSSIFGARRFIVPAP